ncbi:MAG TPA: cytochrome c family protein [Sphingomonadales bacterium]|nr:cytochrome c family protein [Sphingomonadales bacterium]
MMRMVLLMFSLVLGALVSGEARAGDAVKGKQIFGRCTTCHSEQADVSRLGPSLFGIIGRVPGTLASFKNFSPAMKAFGESGKVWDEKTLDGYIANPRTYMPGNRMAFAGVPKPEDRADLITYLTTLKND